MNNMIFSYNNKSDNINTPKVVNKTFNVKTFNNLFAKNSKENANMLFSNNSSLHGSMFQRIQYVTSGCSACGK